MSKTIKFYLIVAISFLVYFFIIKTVLSILNYYWLSDSIANIIFIFSIPIIALPLSLISSDLLIKSIKKFK